jgi:hypothetical protein
MTDSNYTPERLHPNLDLWIVTNPNPTDGFPHDLQDPDTEPFTYETLEAAQEAADDANHLHQIAIKAENHTLDNPAEALEEVTVSTTTVFTEETLYGIIRLLVRTVNYKSVHKTVNKLSSEDRDIMLNLLLSRADTRTLTNLFYDFHNQKNGRAQSTSNR